MRFDSADTQDELSRQDIRQTARWMKRAGHTARGIVYLIVAVLAGSLALSAFGRGGGGAEASPSGAIDAIARQPFGTVLLIALSLGLVAYAIFQIALALRFAEADAGFLHRGGLVISGLFYFALAFLAGAEVFGAGRSASNDPSGLTATVLGWPGGRFLVGAVGVGFVVAGGYMAYRAWTDDFMDRLDRTRMPGRLEDAVESVGTVGLLGRAAGLALIGWFVLLSAVQYQPEEARGLDGALQALARQPYGPWLIGLVALGFLAYALLSFVEAAYEHVVDQDPTGEGPHRS